MDIFVFRLINNFAGQNKILDQIAIFLATRFEYLVVAFLLIWFLVRKRNFLNLVIYPLLSAVLARLVITNLIRFFYHRPRPFLALENVRQLVVYGDKGSFPSGHAAFFFAIAFFIYFYNKKLSSFFFAAAFLISLGRIFVGIHYPTDILGGVLVGFVSALIVKRLQHKSPEI